MFCVLPETKKACYHTICRLFLVFEAILAESGGTEPQLKISLYMV